jgi:hypothetical protein
VRQYIPHLPRYKQHDITDKVETKRLFTAVGISALLQKERKTIKILFHSSDTSISITIPSNKVLAISSY